MLNWLVASAKVPYGYNWTISPWLFVQCTQFPLRQHFVSQFLFAKILAPVQIFTFLFPQLFPLNHTAGNVKRRKVFLFDATQDHCWIGSFFLSQQKLANTLLWKILFSSSPFSPSAVGTSPKVCTEATVERLPQHKVITKETLMGTKIRYRRLWFYGVILARFCFNILLFFLLTFSPNRFDSGCRRDTLNGADDFFPSRKINDF